MYFKFPCTSCGKNLKVSDEHIGRKAQCPYCHTKVLVPDLRKEEEPAPSYTPPATTSSYGSDRDRDRDEDRTEAAAPTAPPQPRTTPKEIASGTDVNMLVAVVIALVVFGIVYGALFPLPKENYFRQLFYDRSWVNFLTVFFTCWTGAIVILKRLKIRRQREAMLFDLLPNDISDDITPANCSKFSAHINEIPVGSIQVFLVNRVRRGLEHFYVRRNAGEVAAVMQSQSDIDNNEVASSYTLLNVFLWAIPILGFIGTVLGISNAVGEFASSMQGSAEIDALKESLQGVVGGLGTAFDTTLVALVFSILMIFPVKTTLKSEEDLLNWVDEYCNENLLKRLKDGSGGGGGSENVKEIHKAINASMADHHAELITWTDKLEKIGEAISRQAARGWTDVHKEVGEEMEKVERKFQEALDRFLDKQRQSIESGDDKYQSVIKTQRELIEGLGGASDKLGRNHKDLMDGLSDASDRLGKTQQEVIGEQGRKMKEIIQQLEDAEERLVEKQKRLNDDQADKVGEIVKRIDDAGNKLAEVQQAMAAQLADARKADNSAHLDGAKALREAADSIIKYTGGMDQALHKLNDTLAKLGEKQVVIQQTTAAAPKKKGWFK